MIFLLFYSSYYQVNVTFKN